MKPTRLNTGSVKSPALSSTLAYTPNTINTPLLRDRGKNDVTDINNDESMWIELDSEHAHGTSKMFYKMLFNNK